jgi:hypothetical protein
MMENGGKRWINNLRKRWRFLSFLRVLFFGLAVALLLTAVFAYFFYWGVWIFVPLFIIAFLGISFMQPFWKTSLYDISRYLDLKYPELEESSSLLLKPSGSLSGLEKFQSQKVTASLPELSIPQALLKKTVIAFIFLLVALSLVFVAFKWRSPKLDSPAFTAGHKTATGIVKERIPAQIAAVSLRISPPAYTGLPLRKQNQLSLKAEVGASVKWQILTSGPVNSLSLKFNDQETVVLSPSDQKRTFWTFNKTIAHAGFYQLVINGKKSDLYPIETIADQPVKIKVISPKQRTLIDYGQSPMLNLKVSLNDDYGIKDAYIAITMASGKGEGVSFTEKKVLFNTTFNREKHLQLGHVLNLKTLGMKPGDELYFFIQAWDNRGQNSRSDVYFVNMVDTAELMSMVGMDNGVNLVPEYFRSQRQIIMDTEKLLKEKNSLTEEVFKNRANNLGLDQKLLRLRYGKFLGEESENEIGGDSEHGEGDGHDHRKAGEEPAKFGDTKALMDQYAHNHDVAEDATFFEPELKAQLKAVLTEMWKAELQLRIYQPQPALPFEYKALRLLKDLQQNSRAYVAKTTVKTSQLKEEKRLSGELDKIFEPLQQNTFVAHQKRALMLNKVLSLLDTRKTGYAFNNTDLATLKAAEQEMMVAAADRPGVYLPALKKLRIIRIAKVVKAQDMELLQRAIQKMMVKEQAKPQQPATVPASDLYRGYFNHLKQMKP